MDTPLFDGPLGLYAMLKALQEVIQGVANSAEREAGLVAAS